MRGSLQVKVIPSVSVRGWLAGDGQITLGLPEPIARELRLAFEAGVELTIEFLFLKKKIRAVARYGCRWTPSRSVECSRDVGSEGLLASRAGTGLTLFLTDYDRFGDYARFGGVPLARRSTGRIPASVRQVEVVSNIFPGASPDIAEVGGGRLLVWEHQDTNDPVVQSTEIAFSWDGGLGWAEPALVADDTRAEISPQVAADGGGRAVAAWLRLKDPNFVDAPETAERLPEFFRQFEVVSAIFDPATRSWSPIMELTDNDFAETDLQLSGSGGRVLATWLENPDGEILATPGSPSSLKHSFWDGDTWTNPAEVASGLVGVARHAAAAMRDEAFVVAAVDPDPDMEGDERLELFTWTGSAWAAETYAQGGGDHLPAAAFDSGGTGHVVWVQNGDLVHATLDDPRPDSVRQGSDSIGFFETNLLSGPEGVLALLWQQSSEEGPGDVFALVFDEQSGTWSADRRLTADETVAYDVSGYFGLDGKVQAVYLAFAPERVSETVLIGGEPVEIRGIPRRGRTDLLVLDHTLVTDLAAVNEDLTATPRSPQPGEAATASLRVHNAGDFAVGEFFVELFAESPEAGRILLGRQAAGPLDGGASLVAGFQFTYPEQGGDLVAVVDADQSVTEFSEANNRAVLPLSNTPPAAGVVATVTRGLAPLAVEFDGTSSVDVDGEGLSYAWDFADGGASAEGPSASHTFEQPGEYPVTLLVTDERGAESTAIVTISVFPSRRYFPFFESGEGAFTGFAFSNFSERTAALELRLFSPEGGLAVGPVTREVRPGQQLSRLGRELFNLDGAGVQEGWVEVRSDNPEIGTFFLFGDSGGLDGSTDSTRYSKTLLFSRIFEGPGAFRGLGATTLIGVVNPTDEQIRLELTLFSQGASGPLSATPAARAERILPAKSLLRESVAELFGAGTEVDDAYVVAEVREGDGVTGFALVSLPEAETELSTATFWILGVEFSTLSHCGVSWGFLLG